VCGYCGGVRRAVDMALRVAAEGGGPVYSLGPLIHNPAALRVLSAKGVQPLSVGELPDRMDGASVIVRAHGVPPETLRLLELKGGRVVDATCPRVKSSQKEAADFFAKGFVLFLVGERTHAEIVGIAGYAPSGIIVASTEDARTEAERLKAARPDAKVALIAQTTISAQEYGAIAEEIIRFFPDATVSRTICPATADRLAALQDLAAECDALVIVGGRDSANTRRLHTLAVQLGKPAWHIEEVGELPEELFGYERVGLTAGASTPDEVVDAVEAALTDSMR